MHTSRVDCVHNDSWHSTKVAIKMKKRKNDKQQPNNTKWFNEEKFVIFRKKTHKNNLTKNKPFMTSNHGNKKKIDNEGNKIDHCLLK